MSQMLYRLVVLPGDLSNTITGVVVSVTVDCCNFSRIIYYSG